MSKISNIDARISKLTSELAALKKEKETLDEKNSLVVSDFVLPPELEAIAGWICQVNKKDFFVQIFGSQVGFGSYLILTTYGVNFVGTEETTIDRDVVSGLINDSPNNIRCESESMVIEIPPINQNISWFISRFCWTDAGYVIEKIPVNSKTGEVCEQYFMDFN